MDRWGSSDLGRKLTISAGAEQMVPFGEPTVQFCYPLFCFVLAIHANPGARTPEEFKLFQNLFPFGSPIGDHLYEEHQMVSDRLGNWMLTGGIALCLAQAYAEDRRRRINR